MDSSQGSSFIPKSPVSGTVNKRRVRKIYVFTYLIYIAFVGSIIAAVGTWIYKLSVANELTTVQAALNAERDRFNQADLDRVTELNARITEAKSIFDNQVSVVQILEAVERVTLSSVDMRGFTFEKDVSTTLALELAAEASDFNTTLFQRQVLAGDPVLGGATVTNVTYASTPATEELPAESTVIFTVEKDIAPGSIKPVAGFAPSAQSSDVTSVPPTATTTVADEVTTDESEADTTAPAATLPPTP